MLDVGCGLGEVCADLVNLVGPSATVTGVDASVELIERARAQWNELPIRFDVDDAEALHFDAATFDAVRAERVLQHLARPGTAIAEMARVLRPGGRVLVSDAVHDATVIATQHTRVWDAMHARGSGAVRQPRAGLYLGEWLQSAGLDPHVEPVARILDNWPLVRTLLRIDDGAALAAADGTVTRAEADEFIAEQEERFDRGVFALSAFFVHAVGVKAP